MILSSVCFTAVGYQVFLKHPAPCYSFPSTLQRPHISWFRCCCFYIKNEKRCVFHLVAVKQKLRKTAIVVHAANPPPPPNSPPSPPHCRKTAIVVHAATPPPPPTPHPPHPIAERLPLLSMLQPPPPHSPPSPPSPPHCRKMVSLCYDQWQACSLAITNNIYWWLFLEHPCSGLIDQLLQELVVACTDCNMFFREPGQNSSPKVNNFLKLLVWQMI